MKPTPLTEKEIDHLHDCAVRIPRTTTYIVAITRYIEAAVNAKWEAVLARLEAAQESSRPFMLLRPKMFPDGNQWCALYGDDLQSGVSGFGDTPDAASRAFDTAWLKGQP